MESRSQASPRAPAGSGRTRSRRASPRTNRFSSRSSSTTPLPRGSAAIGGGVALAQAIWFASDPFGMVHAEAQIAIVGLTATALLAVGFRRSVPLLFLLGYMQKGAEPAYPRRIAGRDYAFPYSPVFYPPFTPPARAPRGIEAAMKHVGLVL